MPHTPKFTIAKPNGGVIPITTDPSTQANAASHETITITKAPSTRLKVLVRRLPPGLTQGEFEAAIGDEWRLGAGKVDWMLYRPGKLSQDLSKSSRPSRAYLHLTNHSHLSSLSDKVRQTSFADSRNTSNDPVLLGPPVIEFAPYSRIPTGKRRNDARQGMIDQDAEFIEFLESLTNPTSKPAALDQIADAAGKKEEVVSVTPLIQFLREKRAAKDKPNAKAAKHSRQESKNEAREAKALAKAAAKAAKESSESGSKRSGRSVRIEKAPKELVKALRKEKEIAALARKPQDSQPLAQTTDATETSGPGPTAPAKKKPVISPASAAARMIQRDLGLRGRDRRRKDASTEPSEPTTTESAAASSPNPTSPSTTTTTPTAPAILRRAEKHHPKSPTAAPAPAPAPAPTAPAPAPTAPAPAPTAPRAPQKPPKVDATTTTTTMTTTTSTQAFLKHANASQGITEPLIHDALAAFGAVLKVEIDKRKGFAYVDFESPQGLLNAIKASPVKVAQGSVQVLERKDRAPTVPKIVAGKGGGGGGGGGGGAAAVAVGSGAGRGGIPTGPAFKGSARGRGVRGGNVRNVVAAAAGNAATAAASLSSPPASAVATNATVTPEI